MELQFNELSVEITPCANKYDAGEKMKQFAQTVAVARKKGFRQIRSRHSINQIILSDNYSLFEWFNDKRVAKDYKDLLYGVITQPFIKEEDDIIEGQFIVANYYFENCENNIERTDCVGLAGAYLYETLCVSLSTHSVWINHKLSVIIEKENQVSTEEVYNLSSKESFDIPCISDFIENRGELSLVESSLHPDDKPIHLAEHHGIAELTELCDQLKYSPYVMEMRSAEWGGKKFIRNEQRDGTVEIVLCKTQRRYALSVKTTGRNYRETNAIAKILEERYS